MNEQTKIEQLRLHADWLEKPFPMERQYIHTVYRGSWFLVRPGEEWRDKYIYRRAQPEQPAQAKDWPPAGYEIAPVGHVIAKEDMWLQADEGYRPVLVSIGCKVGEPPYDHGRFARPIKPEPVESAPFGAQGMYLSGEVASPKPEPPAKLRKQWYEMKFVRPGVRVDANGVQWSWCLTSIGRCPTGMASEPLWRAEVLEEYELYPLETQSEANARIVAEFRERKAKGEAVKLEYRCDKGAWIDLSHLVKHASKVAKDPDARFRIVPAPAPQPSAKPWTKPEQAVGKVVRPKDAAFAHNVSTILGTSWSGEDACLLFDVSGTLSMNGAELLETYEQLDGTPCGEVAK